jgi:hypothetical protein
MTNILSLRSAKKFGLWYLAYEAASLAAFLTFGVHFTSLV